MSPVLRATLAHVLVARSTVPLTLWLRAYVDGLSREELRAFRAKLRGRSEREALR